MIAEFLGEAVILPAVLADGYADCALGHIPVDHPQKHGAATIMLRPEQISLTPTKPNAAAVLNVACGEVVDTDFGGAICTVCIRLANTAMRPTRTRVLQRARIEVPAIGAIVGIKVAGTAHVFEDGDRTWVGPCSEWIVDHLLRRPG